MGGDKDLRPVLATAGVFTKFIRQGPQEFVVQAVLRFFDAQKRMRCRIFKQQKVGEDLQRAVGHLLGVKRILKAFVVESEQQPTVGGFFGVNPVYAGNLLRDSVQDSLETPRMFALHELHDIAEVVAVDVAADPPSAGCSLRPG